METFRLPLQIQSVTGQSDCPIGDAVLVFNDCVLASETCEELFTPAAQNIGLALAGVEVITNGSGSHHQVCAAMPHTHCAFILLSTRWVLVGSGNLTLSRQAPGSTLLDERQALQQLLMGTIRISSRRVALLAAMCCGSFLLSISTAHS